MVQGSELSGQAGGAPVLIGGVVLDVQAQAAGPGDVQRGGSVPGSVRQTPGGVARNIAHSLALLTRKAPFLVSAVGDDAAGSLLLNQLTAQGLPTHGIHRCHNAVTPCVSIVFDRGGEVAAAVADVQLLERELTPALVRRHLQAIRSAPALLLDGNLQPPAIAEACAAAGVGVPVFFEPVSAAKAVRAVPSLRHITFLSPNGDELAALAAEVRRHGYRAEVAGRLAAAGPDLVAVLSAGAGHVLLTLGALGAALCRMGHNGCSAAVLAAHMPALPARVANCCGAGDCLLAGVLMRIIEGGSATDALAHGLAAARYAVESADSVPPMLSAAGGCVAVHCTLLAALTRGVRGPKQLQC
ncbi:hypothetical protein WJX81_002966 [Elliptochloris bilobata]|uniref:Carbohydrate kinase PfkB domain-containing protein n=1 Tax=Elliptochloris bilobata TaxID=381761 RepID=A0AAW1QKV7_9CHLO